jgi:hypothetical protein
MVLKAEAAVEILRKGRELDCDADPTPCIRWLESKAVSEERGKRCDQVLSPYVAALTDSVSGAEFKEIRSRVVERERRETSWAFRVPVPTALAWAAREVTRDCEGLGIRMSGTLVDVDGLPVSELSVPLDSRTFPELGLHLDRLGLDEAAGKRVLAEGIEKHVLVSTKGRDVVWAPKESGFRLSFRLERRSEL